MLNLLFPVYQDINGVVTAMQASVNDNWLKKSDRYFPGYCTT